MNNWDLATTNLNFHSHPESGYMIFRSKERYFTHKDWDLPSPLHTPQSSWLEYSHHPFTRMSFPWNFQGFPISMASMARTEIGPSESPSLATWKLPGWPNGCTGAGLERWIEIYIYICNQENNNFKKPSFYNPNIDVSNMFFSPNQSLSC